MSQQNQEGNQQGERVWQPPRHNDQSGPSSQAARDTPPSSQQYNRWDHFERQQYRDELLRNNSRQYENEIEVLREQQPRRVEQDIIYAAAIRQYQDDDQSSRATSQSSDSQRSQSTIRNASQVSSLSSASSWKRKNGFHKPGDSQDPPSQI